MSDLADYEWLLSDEARGLLADCAQSERSFQSRQERLRKLLSPERARLVVQQVALRQKATEKFGERAQQMFFTDLALQQATDQWIASYKASRFQERLPVIDYCCGIGGDLLALAERAPTIGWDRSPEIIVFAKANLRCWNRLTGQALVGSVEEHPPESNQQWHLDPDRRIDGRRSTHVEWHSPNEQTIESWLSKSPHGAIKLAPAAELSADWQSRAELEWISRSRQCRQLVAWFGESTDSHGLRRATSVNENSHESFVGNSGLSAESAESIGAFVFDTDPAIRAAKLTGALAQSTNCLVIAPGESYLTADSPISHPLLTSFRVTAVMPLRIATLKKHLQSMSLADLEIKTRGVSTSPEQIRKTVKLNGSSAATLLLTRQGKREIAILAERQTAG